MGETRAEASRSPFDDAITDVQGLDRPFTLDIVLKDDIVDACIDNRRGDLCSNLRRAAIDNRRTIVTRYWNPRGDRLFLFAQNADVAFDSVEIRPLSE